VLYGKVILRITPFCSVVKNYERTT